MLISDDDESRNVDKKVITGEMCWSPNLSFLQYGGHPGVVGGIGFVLVDIDDLERCLESTPNRLLFDRYPDIRPLISRWELDKFKNF